MSLTAGVCGLLMQALVMRGAHGLSTRALVHETSRLDHRLLLALDMLLVMTSLAAAESLVVICTVRCGRVPREVAGSSPEGCLRVLILLLRLLAIGSFAVFIVLQGGVVVPRVPRRLRKGRPLALHMTWSRMVGIEGLGSHGTSHRLGCVTATCHRILVTHGCCGGGRVVLGLGNCGSLDRVLCPLSVRTIHEPCMVRRRSGELHRVLPAALSIPVCDIVRCSAAALRQKVAPC